jgi:hypothetical protein
MKELDTVFNAFEYGNRILDGIRIFSKTISSKGSAQDI